MAPQKKPRRFFSRISVMIFTALAAFHVLVWTFVLGAWLHPAAAAANVTLVIPTIYVMHAALPFHVLKELKARVRPGSWRRDNEELMDAWIVPGMLKRVQAYLKKRCYKSPLSPQGMLVFGALTSCWSLIR